MSTVKLVEYEDASPEVRAVYDDIRRIRQTDFINNFWKALANPSDFTGTGLGPPARR